MSAYAALVVDDAPANRDFLVRLIQQTGLKVVGASDGAEALTACEEQSFAVILTDLQLPDVVDYELVDALRKQQPDAKLIVASMWCEPDKINASFEHGCDVYLVKPHGFMELFKCIKDWPNSCGTLDNLIIDQFGSRPYRHDIPDIPDKAPN